VFAIPQELQQTLHRRFGVSTDTRCVYYITFL
jgi:hypothetical protein